MRIVAGLRRSREGTYDHAVVKHSRPLRLVLALVASVAISMAMVMPLASPAHGSNAFTVTVMFSDGTGNLTPVSGAIVTVTTRNYVMPDDGSGFTIIDYTANSSGTASVEAIRGVGALEVRVSARAPGGTVDGVPTTTAYWGQSLSIKTADYLTIDAVHPVTIVLHPTTAVTGSVRATDSLAVGTAASVLLWHETTPGGDWRPITEVRTDSAGRFIARNVPAGDYRFDVRSAASGRLFQREFHPLTVELDDAERFTAIAQTVNDVGALMARPWALESDRIEGIDRYETAVKISELVFDTFLPAPPVLYLVNGLAFPDALSASPLASIAGGGLLLTAPTHLPAVVAAELERLQPQRVVIVGGTGVISSAVENQVSTISQQWGASVDRVNGIDRYETSRFLIEDFPENEAGTLSQRPVFIATGLDFPDALSAASAAGAAGLPLVLVGGINEWSLPTATASLIESLHPPRLFVAGGWATVSPLAINQFADPRELRVVRFGGTDRYETSRLINDFFFGENAVALVANGTRFPDALAAGPLSAALGVPLELTPPSCVHAPLARSLARQGTELALLVGGPGALSSRVAAMSSC